MKPKYFAITALTLAALIGCREQEGAVPIPAIEPSAAQPADAEPLPVEVAADEFVSCVGVLGCNALPTDVVVNIPHQLRSDRVYTHASGANRRQAVFEFTEGDTSTVLQSLQRSFTEAGYQPKPMETTREGIATIVLLKPDAGSANVWVNPSVGASPLNENAKGVFGIDYPAVVSSTRVTN